MSHFPINFEPFSAGLLVCSAGILVSIRILFGTRGRLLCRRALNGASFLSCRGPPRGSPGVSSRRRGCGPPRQVLNVVVRRALRVP